MKHKGAKPKTKSQATKPLHEPNPDAGGIDLSPTEIWVAVPPERAQNSVRKFEAFTKDLIELVQWLVQCGVRTVAMEATGVYWIPLYQLLEDAKIKVCLVNARHVKNVPGRKSDVRDCQWLGYLLSVGLLSGSFSSRPVGLRSSFYLALPPRANLYGRAVCPAYAGSFGSDEYQAALRH